ncbi:hypothetical protein M1M18_gp031 [Halorubrum virus Serpecor1]|uniref:Uncharacterized protein n=1 Tax=Halorubrum virus Serpecor1 TaxID=2721757 RepID=A0A6G9RWB2_9CAUD|nr:hypothetical protein M1M18_gp031 [Halorubrum virus Serpecor1]QIR31269.1 hypothetical protein HrrSp1_540 [Halorubrum virus Serpecor1]
MSLFLVFLCAVLIFAAIIGAEVYHL